MSKKVKVQAIDLDSIITIEVSGNFYARIQQMLMEMANEKSQEEFLKALKKLEGNDDAENAFEYNLHTIMSLIYEIEKQAKAQGKFKEVEIDIPDDDKAL